MPTQRYPDDISIGPDDLDRCKLTDILEQVTVTGPVDLWDTLSKAAKDKIENNMVSEGKVLWILADACSMMLSPDKVNDPYKPLCVTRVGRSAVISDFSDDEIDFFVSVAENIEDGGIRARIADIIWLTKRPRPQRFALMAIQAYKQVPITTNSWIHGGRECWERAIQLAIQLRDSDQQQEIRESLFSAIQCTDDTTGYLPIWIADLLKKIRVEGTAAKEIATKIETLAVGFLDRADYDKAHTFFENADKWFFASGDNQKAVTVRIRSAETLVKNAENSAPAVSANLFEQAIHTYRQIPKRSRKAYSIDNRLDELHQRMTEAAQHSLLEMKPLRHELDLNLLVQESVNSVAGKNKHDALMSFANLYAGTNCAALKQQAAQAIKAHPLTALFAKTMFSRDGRVIAKSPGMSPAEDSADNEAAIWAEMIKHYRLKVAIIVQGEIWVALEVLTQEHHLRESDIIAIASQSPLVPSDRIVLISKGLFAGFEGDFVSAIHLLVPQIENLVRWHLKSAGVRTTTLDNNGIEMEVGLGSLVDKSEFNSIFGDDLAFELRAIFTDALGPNLRNEVAHGLLGLEEAQSIYVIYAWWWLFKLIFNTFLNSQHQSARANGSAGSSSTVNAKDAAADN